MKLFFFFTIESVYFNVLEKLSVALKKPTIVTVTLKENYNTTTMAGNVLPQYAASHW